jgi:hypothetical protein
MDPIPPLDIWSAVLSKRSYGAKTDQAGAGWALGSQPRKGIVFNAATGKFSSAQSK